jgi:hypothetical protein
MTRIAILTAVAMLALVARSDAGTPTRAWPTYRDPHGLFRVSYPAGWKVDTDYVYPGFGPDHEIHGVVFLVPKSLTRGTNLSPSLTGVSIESLPAKGPCSAHRFLPDAQEPRTLKNAGRTWSTANAQDAGAGNFYDFAVFAISGSDPCMAVRYTIHSTNIDNYDPGTVKAFDSVDLVRTFAAIRQSLRLGSDR